MLRLVQWEMIQQEAVEEQNQVIESVQTVHHLLMSLGVEAYEPLHPHQHISDVNLLKWLPSFSVCMSVHIHSPTLNSSCM